MTNTNELMPYASDTKDVVSCCEFHLEYLFTQEMTVAVIAGYCLSSKDRKATMNARNEIRLTADSLSAASGRKYFTFLELHQKATGQTGRRPGLNCQCLDTPSMFHSFNDLGAAIRMASS